MKYMFFILLSILTFSCIKDNLNPISLKGDEYMTKQKLLTKLTPLQYHVTQENGTEQAFNNKYWNNKEPGIYVDIISEEPLFSSKDKFHSGTGWPSFTKPISSISVIEVKDTSYGMTRIEIRSKKSDSHLGHLFNDGPPPNGKRYCINSAALLFIPEYKLEEEGYEAFDN